MPPNKNLVSLRIEKSTTQDIERILGILAMSNQNKAAGKCEIISWPIYAFAFVPFTNRPGKSMKEDNLGMRVDKIDSVAVIGRGKPKT